jgi:hypothetical protein
MEKIARDLADGAAAKREVECLRELMRGDTEKFRTQLEILERADRYVRMVSIVRDLANCTNQDLPVGRLIQEAKKLVY